MVKQLAEGRSDEKKKIAQLDRTLKVAINDISDTQSRVNNQIKGGLAQQNEAIEKSKVEIVHLNKSL